MKSRNRTHPKKVGIRRRINDAVMLILLWPKDFINRHCPQSIRQFYWLVMSGAPVLILYGWSSFWQRYRRYRQNENNISRWQTQLKQGSERQMVFKIEPKQFLPLQKQKVAVVAHAYYMEVFPEICSYLKEMPCPYTMLVSVMNEEDRQSVIRQTAGLPRLEKVIVKTVENRGRDIKPFLVDFAAELPDYDYICKVHTKKSLHTGEEKIDRREYLYQMVMGSRQRMQAILTIFLQNSDVGIVYPARFKEMPYWSYTWLSNKWIAAPVVNRLGIVFDPEEYIDYPSGSMFWIKKEALKPLLDMRLRGDDFPDEKGQTDGELQHVLERCFALSAQSAGLRHVVITDLKKDIFSFSDAMKIASYFITSPSVRIRDALPLVDVVSFDIFDTLLSRPFATPGMVFQYLEEIVQQRYGIKDFMRLRQEAAARLRRQLGASGDVKISQIYRELAQTAGISPQIAGELLELELATEIRLLIPRRDVLASFEEAKEAGKRVILITDTYFEREHIERILAAKGISGYHHLYISCEEGRRKNRGDMWDHVIEREGLTFDNYLHVGDNEQSDLQMPGNRGYYRSLVHVMRPSALFRQHPYGRYLWQMLNPHKGWKENLLYGMIGNHFCLDTYPCEFWYNREPLSDPYALGYTVFGPLMYSFTAWLVRAARQDGVDRLYFLSREGYVMQQMYDDIAGSDAFKQAGLDLPESRYLLTSRRAALFAGLQRQEDLLPFLDRDYTGTLRYFFQKRLYAGDLNMQAIEKKLGREMLDRTVSLPADYAAVKSALFNVFDVLASQAETERGALLAYCGQKGLLDDVIKGLVDVGYFCTIQRALIKLLNRPLKGYYFAIDDKAEKIREGGSLSRGYLGESNSAGMGAHVILKYGLLIESILTSPDGQLIGFKPGKDGAEPVFKPAGISQQQFGIIARIHRGMRDFAGDVLQAFGADALNIEFPAQELLFLYQMIALGSIDIGDLKKSLSVEDEYCGAPEVAVIDFYAGTYGSGNKANRSGCPAGQAPGKEE